MTKRIENIFMGLMVVAANVVVLINYLATKGLFEYDRKPYWLLSSIILLIMVILDKCQYLPFGIIPIAAARFYILVRFFVFDPSCWPADYVPVLVMSRIAGIFFLIGCSVFIGSYYNKRLYKYVYFSYAVALVLTTVCFFLSDYNIVYGISPLLCMLGYLFCYESYEEAFIGTKIIFRE